MMMATPTAISATIDASRSDCVEWFPLQYSLCQIRRRMYASISNLKTEFSVRSSTSHNVQAIQAPPSLRRGWRVPTIEVSAPHSGQIVPAGRP